MTSGSTQPDGRRSILEFLEQKAGRKMPVALRADDSVPVLKPVDSMK